ncbi:PREDICTED: transcription factor SPEECHLESS [Theobroma cacao]|uniref:Transcription factor SPEECHLESS n=2 Tax=Theobroma cacao TaxID=3641 RepID=A0AB32VCT3_THECC|nr:PREDICTED: transcription factor SPEECHLESS [Theobroma cacao]EOY23456.1 Basic helix-loop-helix DNA-binding superfamily protein [Theobroma cacao]
MDDTLCDFLEEPEFGETNLAGDDLFALFEGLDGLPEFPLFTPLEEMGAATQKDGEEATRLVSQKSTSSSAQQESETEPETPPKSKRQKLASSEETNPDGQQRMSHITVERNRRKQMNEHLSVLRSLMPCFYVKRGDQASIIGGVVDYINELQQVLQSLEAKKQRKVYSEVLSPRIVSSPRPSPLSPRKPPLSPRINLPISPRTPQPSSPYKPRLQQGYLSPTMTSSIEPSPTSSASSVDNVNELVANSKSPIADVEVKFSGPNLLLKTVSPRIPGQAEKIISALEDLSLEILHVNINTVDETMLNAFTIKIGIECQLSAEELAHQIQQTFC